MITLRKSASSAGNNLFSPAELADLRRKFSASNNMKKIALSFCHLFFLSIIAIAQTTEQGFYYSIKGSVAKLSNVKKICINYEIVGDKKEECFAVKATKFDFRSSLIQPTAGTISTDNANIKPLKIFLGNTDFNFKIADEINFVTKPKLQTEFENLVIVDNIRPNYFALYGELGEKNDERGLAKLGELFESLKKSDINISYLYFKNNPKSLLSIYAFERFSFFQDDYSLLDKDFSELPDLIKTSVIGKYVSNKIEGAKAVAIGKTAPNFTQNSIDGKAASLENFKGKYILLDFWASWCVPCRNEHPDFLKIYEKYQAKNFEIVSVSIDEDKTAWINASNADRIGWTNLLDTKGQANEVAVKYGVQAVPANFLINPSGVIIAKNLKSEDLEQTLAGLFK
jgi:peroxiredoxin